MFYGTFSDVETHTFFSYIRHIILKTAVHENVGYLSEPSPWGNSNEFSQHIFRDKEKNKTKKKQQFSD